jgi:hypothetical protein
LRITVDREILSYPGSPLKEVIPTVDQNAMLSYLTYLKVLLQKKDGEISVETRLKVWRLYHDNLWSAMSQGLVEKGRVKNHRFRSSWADVMSDLDYDRIKADCIVDFGRRQEEFESFVFPPQGEIIVPQRVLDRLKIGPDDTITLHYRVLLNEE